MASASNETREGPGEAFLSPHITVFASQDVQLKMLETIHSLCTTPKPVALPTMYAHSSKSVNDSLQSTLRSRSPMLRPIGLPARQRLPLLQLPACQLNHVQFHWLILYFP
ncbi:hypothetical protein PCASD_23703 [Puccinia coronata f. sp. avenae]|uniref:Uncharacterized protein n=1 Tax=Puccinia coronata f. sp. avenae TaxID=200324 RepID=A0A2N5U6Z0_9BASI|nr:hypothetical protein PCASD_23566 [Puccinia coronata f. sp. avenae]PLW33523.1 hypothetical protein PCASD_23703 [Puccinia coronata f. sp. avenae]